MPLPSFWHTEAAELNLWAAEQRRLAGRYHLTVVEDTSNQRAILIPITPAFDTENGAYFPVSPSANPEATEQNIQTTLADLREWGRKLDLARPRLDGYQRTLVIVK